MSGQGVIAGVQMAWEWWSRVTFVYLVLTLDLTLEAACEGIPGPCPVVFLVVMYYLGTWEYLRGIFSVLPFTIRSNTQSLQAPGSLRTRFRIPLHRRLPSARLRQASSNLTKPPTSASGHSPIHHTIPSTNETSVLGGTRTPPPTPPSWLRGPESDRSARPPP